MKIIKEEASEIKHRIDPKVDCVFKSILGKEENRNLLIHFLNAVLEPEPGKLIREARILNPYNEKEFIGAKQTVVDVKAADENGSRYQIEIQLEVHAALSPRMLFTWSSIYHSQIQEGDGYGKLAPVISIWILNGNLFPEKSASHLSFGVCDIEHRTVLTDHLQIHVLQLPKWEQKKRVLSEKDRWMCLFKEGENIDPDSPPKILDTDEMRQIMKVLRRFSESQEDYLFYQSRLDAMLTHNTWLHEMEDIRKKAEQAERKRIQAEQSKKQAQKEKKQAQKDKMQAQKEKVQAQKEKVQAQKEKVQAEDELRNLRTLMKEKGIKIPDDKAV
ncbi:MAG: Rpn family recombination-promoting nuclease/putative transposase [Desulfococcaceae bacterium]